MSQNDHAPTVGELLLLVQEIRSDVGEIKAQTTLTNGRVTELEIGVRVRAALEEARQRTMVEQAESLARNLEADRARRAELLALKAGRLSKRQWAVGTVVATAGVLTAMAGVLVGQLI